SRPGIPETSQSFEKWNGFHCMAFLKVLCKTIFVLLYRTFDFFQEGFPQTFSGFFQFFLPETLVFWAKFDKMLFQ
ncbi:MAG: hypothetical protein ACI4UF_11680, partial [Thermoguttaceae bacterium]